MYNSDACVFVLVVVSDNRARATNFTGVRSITSIGAVLKTVALRAQFLSFTSAGASGISST